MPLDMFRDDEGKRIDEYSQSTDCHCLSALGYCKGGKRKFDCNCLIPARAVPCSRLASYNIRPAQVRTTALGIRWWRWRHRVQTLQGATGTSRVNGEMD